MLLCLKGIHPGQSAEVDGGIHPFADQEREGGHVPVGLQEDWSVVIKCFVTMSLY